MTTVTSYTAARMQEIEDSAIIDGNIVGDNLIFTRFDGGTIDAGVVKGDPGPTGPAPSNVAYGILGMAQVVTAHGSITTVQDLVGASVTVNVAAGRRIKITGQASVYTTVAGDQYVGYIKEGATIVGVWYNTVLPNAANYVKQCGMIVISPSTGLHTYKLTLERASGTGNGNLIPTSYDPILILVEDIGPV